MGNSLMGQPITRRAKRRSDVLKTSTIRDFGGGWNVIDNDLNLSTKFAKVLDNMSRLPDGSIGIRWGTRLFVDFSLDLNYAAYALGTNPLTTTIGSAVITVTDVAHGYQTGHKVTLADSAAIDGIPASEINVTHVINEVVDIDNYTVVVTTTGTAGVSGGGGASCTAQSHNDNHKLTGDVVNVAYFSQYLIVFDTNGEVARINATGDIEVLWNDNMAIKGSALSSAPSAAWTAITFVSFAVFNGELICCNGLDKPIKINLTNTVSTNYADFLQDVATATNTNVPVCRYVVAVNRYLLMAGDPQKTDRIHVSNTDTSGTWLGDPTPNDATQIDLGKWTSEDDQTIKGLGRFRNKVVAGFNNATLLGTLGTYDTATIPNHIPDFSDEVAGSGVISHRSMQTLGNDFLMCDLVGVPSLQRALVTDSLRPQRLSELIDPEIQAVIDTLTTAALENYIFSVYNKKEGQYYLFIPNNSNPAYATETIGFVFSTNNALKIKAWSRYKGLNFTCGCRSSFGRVFFGKGAKIYVQGNKQDPVYADYVDDIVLGDADGTGTAISFTWELPWSDFDRRIHTKTNRYIALDTKGTAQFTLQTFVDNLYENKQTSALTPALTANFVGGDAVGFGGGTQNYGGSRRTADERLWRWPVKHKIMKNRIFGSTKEPLKIISMTVAYFDGSIRR